MRLESLLLRIEVGEHEFEFLMLFVELLEDFFGGFAAFHESVDVFEENGFRDSGMNAFLAGNQKPAVDDRRRSHARIRGKTDFGKKSGFVYGFTSLNIQTKIFRRLSLDVSTDVRKDNELRILNRWMTLI